VLFEAIARRTEKVRVPLRYQYVSRGLTWPRYTASSGNRARTLRSRPIPHERPVDGERMAERVQTGPRLPAGPRIPRRRTNATKVRAVTW